MKTCSYCGGSGRDAVTPSMSCFQCGGMGSIPFQPGDRLPSSGRSGTRARGGSGEGCLGIIAVILFIAAFYSIGAGYTYSSEVVFHYWADARYSEHDWGNFFIYVGVSFGALLLVSRFWGLWFGALVAIVPILPVIHSARVNSGFDYIVSGADVAAGSGSFTRVIAILGMLALHGVCVWAMHKSGFIEKHGLWWWAKSRSGRIVTAVTFAVCASLAFTVIKAVQNF